MINVFKDLLRDSKGPHYKPLMLLMVLDFIKERKELSNVIPAKIIINRFESFINNTGHAKHNNGFLPFFFLSIQKKPIWKLYTINHKLFDRNFFSNKKKVPKSKKQLLRYVNYALINPEHIEEFIDKNKSERLRYRLKILLKRDKYKLSREIYKFYD